MTCKKEMTISSSEERTTLTRRIFYNAPITKRRYAQNKNNTQSHYTGCKVHSTPFYNITSPLLGAHAPAGVRPNPVGLRLRIPACPSPRAPHPAAMMSSTRRAAPCIATTARTPHHPHHHHRQQAASSASCAGARGGRQAAGGAAHLYPCLYS